MEVISLSAEMVTCNCYNNEMVRFMQPLQLGHIRQERYLHCSELHRSSVCLLSTLCTKASHTHQCHRKLTSNSHWSHKIIQLGFFCFRNLALFQGDDIQLSYAFRVSLLALELITSRSSRKRVSLHCKLSLEFQKICTSKHSENITYLSIDNQCFLKIKNEIVMFSVL